MNIEIINSLNLILATYQSIVAFFYKKIRQTYFTNNQLAVYNIDYSLLLPSSQYVVNLNKAQVNAQVQAYIDLCNALVVLINKNVNTQTNLFYEQIQNGLNNSITQLNGFSISLLQAQYNNLFSFKVPYTMGLDEAIFLNNLDLSTYPLQATLNYNVQDFNNIEQDSTITLSR